ncbi:ATP-binding protein [Palleronia sp.]|uniref:ATP-binding protein n=1 Tax=Palleronia sp. TaxID=1940284 RepID=UPI0035C815C4
MSAETFPQIRCEEVVREDGCQELRVLYRGCGAATREALHIMTEGLRDFGISEADLQTAQQVMAEILNNVVEHAYADNLNGLIEIRLICEASAIRAQIIDAGRPMPGEVAPDPAPPNPAGMPEGGFGWCIIRAMTDEVSYVRERGRNNLSIAFRLHDTGR